MKIGKKTKRVMAKISAFILVILMLLSVVVSYIPYIFY